ncbi:hypothetical protein RRG08_033530 [Elysia crispata]|uniref:Uncharacterized protein n=1 Tax=Elysia crispata TaxID=231223 RepID=A0AAE1CJP8_9GAST|nr:hypothetical protein RRG08_033530 [Elysia crispata]
MSDVKTMKRRKNEMKTNKRERNNEKTLRSNGVRHDVNFFRASHISCDTQLFEGETAGKYSHEADLSRRMQQEGRPQERIVMDGNFNIWFPDRTDFTHWDEGY